MSTIAIHPPKTPVTKGSNGIAAATVPNVCKMPGPPAPFVPTPLPNIGKSGDDPQGYTSTVKFDGQPVAIRGASFGSQGDMASKGTGGGLISANTHGPTKFLGPGSLTVQAEGKNVQLLSDPMLNNCGPGGSPANAATMTGLVQTPEVAIWTEHGKPECSGGSQHCWEAQPAKRGGLERKIAEAKAARSQGTQFEGLAAEHNKKSGDLKRDEQLSGRTHEEKIFWRCSICGMAREGDQLHDGPTEGSAPIAVEVKSKPHLDPDDVRQLGRNIQAAKQGGASGVLYKVPAGNKGSIITGQIRAIGEMLGCAVKIIRI